MNSQSRQSPAELRTRASVALSSMSETTPAKCYHLEFDDRAAFHLVNFYEPESVGNHFFRWSEPVAMVRLDLPAADYEITIETAQLRCGGLQFPFRLFWNDLPIARKNIRLSKGRIIFRVDRVAFIRNDEQRLTISCKPLNAEKGRRQLGLPVKWIRLQQVGANNPEFANPTKTRSRLWQPGKKTSFLRRLFGLKAPSPIVPIWEMKLPNVMTSLRGQQTESEAAPSTNELVIVSSVEINSRHGTGLLIQYMFEDFSQITTVSSQRCFHGDRVRSSRHLEVPFEPLERCNIYELVLKWFKQSPPKRAYVVPFYKTELLVAIALNDLFGTEICLHIMDDQCLLEDEIPLALMTEAMRKSSLVLVISPEMREAYGQRFGSRIYLLPPVVPEAMIQRSQPVSLLGTFEEQRHAPRGLAHWLPKLGSGKYASQSERGIILGNIWDDRWLDELQTTIRDSGYQVDWYCNNPDAVLLTSHRDELQQSGIFLQEPLWGDDLVTELRKRPYAIMPSGTLGPDEKRENLARLSLPSRIPFVTAVSHIPIIVLGSSETAAAKFVQRFELGLVVDYQPQQFQVAVKQLLQPEIQAEIRQRSARIAPSFSAYKLADWLRESTQLRQPVDHRFESLFAEIPNTRRKVNKLARRTNWNKEKLWRMLQRLKKQGIPIDHVVDVGSGDGAWSWAASQVFPSASYLLIEPLLSHYSQRDRALYEQALNQSQVLQVPWGDDRSDWESVPFGGRPLEDHGSGTPKPATGDRPEIPSLDAIVRSKNIDGPSLLKIDMKPAEHSVLAGGLQFIKSQVNVLLMTTALRPTHSETQSYGELLLMTDALGFQLVDESVAKRCPQTEVLLSKNLVFVKKEICHRKLAARAA